MTSALHEKAMALATQYRSAESALLSVLMQMRRQNQFLVLGYRGMFDYVMRALKLSEAQAVYFSQVAKKSEEVPELKAAIDEGKLTLSKARRIVAVVTPSTALEWIDKAASLPQRELEKLVTEVNPNAVVKERIRPVAPSRVELKVGLGEKAEKALRRAQDLLSRKKNKAVSLEEVIEALTAEYLDRHDPVIRAQRATERKPRLPSSRSVNAEKTSSTSKRRPLAAQVLHEVNLRDQGQCTHLDAKGSRCQQTRFTQLHHLVPKALGGADSPSNLTTLCSAHHAMRHLGEYRPKKPSRQEVLRTSGS